MTLMPGPVKRRYDATRRRQAAARTRAAILDAARELFTERGYAATPMTAIADRAGVALDTVYAAVGRKPELARLLIETAISGTDQAIPAEQRDYVQRDPGRPRRRHQDRPSTPPPSPRSRPAWPSCWPSSSRPPPTNPSWRRCGTEIAERRAANMRLFVADLATVHPLRLDADEAADIVWATNAAELYQLLVSRRGWTPQRYERFLTDTWHRLLLAD